VQQFCEERGRTITPGGAKASPDSLQPLTSEPYTDLNDLMRR